MTEILVKFNASKLNCDFDWSCKYNVFLNWNKSILWPKSSYRKIKRYLKQLSCSWTLIGNLAIMSTLESCCDKSGFLTAICGPAAVLWIWNFRYLGFWITLKQKSVNLEFHRLKYSRSCTFYNLVKNFHVQFVSCLEKIMIYKISTFNRIISAISATLENCFWHLVTLSLENVHIAR